MTKSRATRGKDAQFTYDFGIAIAQSTVNKITRLTGATLTLASAFYALKTSASQYVDVLRENTLRFGGVLSTMKAMEQAQQRLIKGQSYFDMSDQLKGMNQLMAAGINVGKNLDWINKAAHATGKSFEEFSGLITSAIQGNSQALVDAGLMTQRATRMFDKYVANTIMRQNAILNFVKTHKGLLNAIKNDFETIQDQMTRIKGIWTAFIQSIVGKPNDPSSLYGQTTSSLKLVAESLAKNSELLSRYGYIIGQTIGWVVKQIGHFVVWIGKKAKEALQSIWTVTDDFQNQARSIVVWLEFWKLEVLDFFNAYGGAIKDILKLLIAFKAMKAVFVISDLAYMSLIRYKKAMKGLLALQSKYLVFMGPAIGNKFSRWLQSLAVFMPRWLRRIWVSVGKFLERNIFGGGFKKFFKSIGPFFLTMLKGLGKALKLFVGLFRNLPALFTAALNAGRALVAFLLGSNPVGWIILAISLMVLLYTKSERYRKYMNNLFKMIFEAIKLIWNSIAYVITYIMIGCKKIWGWLKEYIWQPVSNFFASVGNWIADMWNKFKDTTVGKWIDRNIIQPIKSVFEWIVEAWDWVISGLGKAIDWLSGANDKVSKATEEAAEKYGVPKIKTFAGGDYDTSDSTNYLNPKNWGLSNTQGGAESIPENPLLSGSSGAEAISEPLAGQGSSQMVFNDGAIKIIVEKGENIDESKLAKKIKEVIMNIERDNKVRGGTL